MPRNYYMYPDQLPSVVARRGWRPQKVSETAPPTSWAGQRAQNMARGNLATAGKAKRTMDDRASDLKDRRKARNNGVTAIPCVRPSLPRSWAGQWALAMARGNIVTARKGGKYDRERRKALNKPVAVPTFGKRVVPALRQTDGIMSATAPLGHQFHHANVIQQPQVTFIAEPVQNFLPPAFVHPVGLAYPANVPQNGGNQAFLIPGLETHGAPINNFWWNAPVVGPEVAAHHGFADLGYINMTFVYAGEPMDVDDGVYAGMGEPMDIELGLELMEFVPPHQNFTPGGAHFANMAPVHGVGPPYIPELMPNPPLAHGPYFGLGAHIQPQPLLNVPFFGHETHFDPPVNDYGNQLLPQPPLNVPFFGHETHFHPQVNDYGNQPLPQRDIHEHFFIDNGPVRAQAQQPVEEYNPAHAIFVNDNLPPADPRPALIQTPPLGDDFQTVEDEEQPENGNADWEAELFGREGEDDDDDDEEEEVIIVI